MELIDFTKKINNLGEIYITSDQKKKIKIYYKNKYYIIKFPLFSFKSYDYRNNIISEYIGCKIYESVEIPVQNVILGTYNFSSKNQIIIACELFTQNNIFLKDFSSFQSKELITLNNKTDLLTTLDSIPDVINKQKTIEHFWNMFIIDAFIGNWDRNNGNWGYIYNENIKKYDLAPIFDCENSLYSNLSNNAIQNIMLNINEIYYRIFSTSNSIFTINNKPINYFNFITSLENEDCNAALKRIVPKINMDKICNIINDIPCITELQKEFYITMLKKRKELLLDFPLYMLKNR